MNSSTISTIPNGAEVAYAFLIGFPNQLSITNWRNFFDAILEEATKRNITSPVANKDLIQELVPEIFPQFEQDELLLLFCCKDRTAMYGFWQWMKQNYKEVDLSNMFYRCWE